MRMQLEVEFEDGKKETVSVNMADMVKFESHFNLSITKLGQEMRISHLLWLAWSALSRQGLKDDFDTWVEKVGNIGSADPKASKG